MKNAISVIWIQEVIYPMMDHDRLHLQEALDLTEYTLDIFVYCASMQ